MPEATTQVSLVPFLEENRELLQFLICAAGTLIGATVIILAFELSKKPVLGKTRVVPLAFVLLLLLGSASYLAPLGTLNGDGAVHQEKMWFVSQSVRHGSLPEWSFFWFGGGLVNECYGPLYYIIFAVPMIFIGVSSKWSIVIITLTCFAVSAALIVHLLSRKYGMFAASLAGACHLFSPARAAAYWYDGTPHRLVIDFVCLLYVLYLWRNLSKAPAYKIGLVLGVAASACVYFHLQFGGIATLLLFSFTAVTLAFGERTALTRSMVACLVGLAVFLPTAGLHYLYYFVVKPDLVADADSLRYMIAPMNQWISNVAAASIWDWGSRAWEVHYFGIVPLFLSLVGVICLFNADRFSFFSSAFVFLIYAGTAIVPRMAVFGPVFFVPTVAAVIQHVGGRFVGGRRYERGRVLGLAVSLIVLFDVYPSNFQLPYRPGSGDRPVAEALADVGPSRGRVVVSSPDKQYENNAADRFYDLSQVNSPSIFGPTFQLSTRMLGYAAMISRQAWLEFERTGTISQRVMAYLALLDISDVLLYQRNNPIVHLQVPNFRPAWRVEQFTCDKAAGSLTKLNWDDVRALGLGARNDAFDNDDEIAIDASRGTVRGIRLDCGGLDAWVPLAKVATAAGIETVTDAHYDVGMSTAEFSIDARRPGLFLLPFGYARDLRVERGGKEVAVYRTNEWMTVVELPAGHSDIRITARPRQMALRRTMDLVFIIFVIATAFKWLWACWQRQRAPDYCGSQATADDAA